MRFATHILILKTAFAFFIISTTGGCNCRTWVLYRWCISMAYANQGRQQALTAKCWSDRVWKTVFSSKKQPWPMQQWDQLVRKSRGHAILGQINVLGCLTLWPLKMEQKVLAGSGVGKRATIRKSEGLPQAGRADSISTSLVDEVWTTVKH